MGGKGEQSVAECLLLNAYLLLMASSSSSLQQFRGGRKSTHPPRTVSIEPGTACEASRSPASHSFL